MQLLLEQQYLLGLLLVLFLQQGVDRGARRWRLQGLSGNRFSDAATTGHL